MLAIINHGQHWIGRLMRCYTHVDSTLCCVLLPSPQPLARPLWTCGLTLHAATRTEYWTCRCSFHWLGLPFDSPVSAIAPDGLQVTASRCLCFSSSDFRTNHLHPRHSTLSLISTNNTNEGDRLPYGASKRSRSTQPGPGPARVRELLGRRSQVLCPCSS